MKVVLVAPPSSIPSAITRFLAERVLSPPLGLLYLATAIKDRFDVQIVDGQLHHATARQLADRILGYHPDVVGLSLNFTPLLSGARTLARSIKEADDSIQIYCGGNFATFYADELMRDPSVDGVVLREGEITFDALVSRLARGETPAGLPGLLCRNGGTVRSSEFGGYIDDLDRLPFPDYRLLEDPTRYGSDIATSRGCPYRCIYCSTQEMWHAWRARSPANVIGEMQEHIAAFKTKRFNFVDDNFAVDRPRVREFVRLLDRERIGATWGFSARVEMLDAELIELVGRANCRGIFLGIESGTESVLEHLGRGYSVTDVEKTVDACIANGILPIASFMIGMPWETRDNVRATLRLMERLNTPLVMVSVFTPLPGTAVRRHPERYGLSIEDHDGEYDNLDGGIVFHRTEHLSAEEIRDLWFEGVGIASSRRDEMDEYTKQMYGGDRGRQISGSQP